MFQLTFETDNAAFGSEENQNTDDMAYEIERILNKVKTQVVSGYTEHVILDINGNIVGSWELI